MLYINKYNTYLVAIAFFAIVIPIACGCHRDTRAYMLCTYFDLSNYAHDHGGWFPQSDKNSYEALQKLYPEYSDGPELAGLSGDSDLVVKTLKSGRALNKDMTSWVYVQGFKDSDDSRLVILWESKAGLSSDGRDHHVGGHAVMYLNGRAGQIADSDWTNFLTRQFQLRESLTRP